MASAEDALAEAFLAALNHWPKDGLPDKPEAWLLTAARRKLIDQARQERVQENALPALMAAAEEAQSMVDHNETFPDERLKLLFTCAHPALDASVRTPLILQTVLGLDAARIASAFLVKPSAMGQRLSRAKTKIRDAGIAFEVPEREELPERLDAVLEAIYAAYGSGWEDIAGSDPRRKGLAEEALNLGTLVVHLLPEEPEAKGLYALMLHCEARRKARRTSEGGYIPLSEQDVQLWSKPYIWEAERQLAEASSGGRVGRFQLEAAIQSIHAQRACTGSTDWEAISLVYEGLIHLAPTVGALVGRAAAVAEARGPKVGWSLLQVIPEESVATYQPYWALAAHLLTRMGKADEAKRAFERAIGLSEDPAARAFLKEKLPT